MATKASNPDEKKLSDLTVFIFDEEGYLEKRRSYDKEELVGHDLLTFNVSLLKGKKYSIYACANIGRNIPTYSLTELLELKCHLVYPDEYREGIPMAGQATDIIIEDDVSEIVVELKRIMAKISLRVDRGGLSDGVKMNVISARIGNCPKSSFLFRHNSIVSNDDCFKIGFTRTESECGILNRNTGNGLSGELSLYMLENMQGDFNDTGIDNDSEKIFDELDIRRQTCSYIELKIDYESGSYYSTSDPLIYRFYLGQDRNNLDIERNCHYHITVIPEDDGLSDDGWRVDKTGLIEANDSIHFNMQPSGYIQGFVGDDLNVRCSFHPKDAEFEIGLEELEYDKERGIYDYKIDEDGHGVTLSLKSPGTGIIYMSVGEPVNEAGMLVLEVNDIKN